MQVRTNGNSSPKGKARVFFTCHPNDWDRCFDKICEDIFKTHDVAIYYVDDEDKNDDDLLKTDMGQMNLFVIPISFKLLIEPCFAMQIALPFAKSKHIPILPIMLEQGLESLYAKDDNFGSLQFLDPYSHDLTAVSYEKKLKDYLDSVIIGDEMAERVRKAFDAYVFLSYRKKDRAHANELMRLIHNDPLCRDIAIWYDEYLVPGEAFDDAIVKAMEKSDFFTLLVTPNLVNETNYVQSEEYPRAIEADLSILPIEMVSTNRNELEKQYPGIPKLIKKDDEDGVRRHFLQNIKRIAKSDKDNDPQHCFLIGLAYLEGIDVEVDRERGVELIKRSAEFGLPEAMKKLAEMYESGYGVNRDYNLYLKWYEKAIHAYKRILPDDDCDMLIYQNNLVYAYNVAGRYENAIELGGKLYEQAVRVMGEENELTLTILGNYARALSFLCKYKEALDTDEKIYSISVRTLGDQSSDALLSLNNIGSDYTHLGDYYKALEFYKKAYNGQARLLGETNSLTLLSLENIGIVLGNLGNYKESLKVLENVYEIRKQELGDDHSDTISSLFSVSLVYRGLGMYRTSLRIAKEVYDISFQVFGEYHPKTCDCLHAIGTIYRRAFEVRKACEIIKEVYDKEVRLYGEENLNSAITLNDLAVLYGQLGQYDKAISCLERVYKLGKTILGENHPSVITYLFNISLMVFRKGKYEEALGLCKEAFDLYNNKLGEEHPSTLNCMHELAIIHDVTCSSKIAKQYAKQSYVISKRVLGANHPDTFNRLGLLLLFYICVRPLRRLLLILLYRNWRFQLWGGRLQVRMKKEGRLT